MADPKVRLPFNGAQRLTQGFGERPDFYKERLGLPGHNGIDWGMTVGTHIVAVDAGKVVLVDNTPTGFGLHIKLDHSWGQSLYAHLHRIDARDGQSVREGEEIALSGNTGLSSGPHLHFGLRVKPYNTTDGWHGYTNPHRYLNWPGGAATDPRAVELEKRIQDFQAELQDLRNGFDFERQELGLQADIWREAVTDLLRKHMPGDLPRNADVLTTLDSLMANWSEEINTQRAAAIAGIFGPPPDFG